MKQITLLFIITASLASCKKFLDGKPDKKLTVPATLKDVKAILDAYSMFNSNSPSIGAQSDDNYWISDVYWNTLSITYRNNYIWAKDAINETDWSYGYQRIVNANTALETVDKIQPTSATLDEWNYCKGAAHFFRAYSFYYLAQYYAEPYNKNTAAQKLGIVLRLSSDATLPSVRSSLEQTWQQILKDLREAAEFLPVTTSPVSRPSKPAAFAMLARTYLDMGDYTKAGLYADSCLQLYNTLIDYNNMSSSAAIPFTRFNVEVLFNSVLLGPQMLNQTNWHCDSLLYQSYDVNDLRKGIFFKTGGIGFKGNYDGTSTANYFNGLAVDEMFLVRAECFARNNNTVAALNDLNTLLSKRWKAGTFIGITAVDADDALQKILNERRKELVGRGIRWFDLRRLNQEPRFAITLSRVMGGTTYSLPPADNRYTFLIPDAVISMTGIPQNTR